MSFGESASCKKTVEEATFSNGENICERSTSTSTSTREAAAPALALD